MKLQFFMSLPVAMAAMVFAQETSPDTRLRHTTEAFQDIMKTPDKGIPRDLLEKAQCIVIIPDLKKGAFLVGGKYGRGFASCRHEAGWSSPAAIRIEGGSFGLQLGGSATDLIMLVMNKRGMDRLLGDKFTIGGEAAAAAGPVGRDLSAETDAMLHAEILTWSRSRGLFAGLSLEGATLRPDGSENRKLYGRDLSNREILETGVSTPLGARQFVAMLNGYRPHREAASDESARERLSRPGGRLTLTEGQIHFATGQSAVPADAEATLMDVARTLKENPSWRVQVQGYTDNVGSNSSNLELSQSRAEAVRNWLIDHGVNPKQLSAKGYGETRAVATNSTEEGRSQNRRVEVVRMDIKGLTSAR